MGLFLMDEENFWLHNSHEGQNIEGSTQGEDRQRSVQEVQSSSFLNQWMQQFLYLDVLIRFKSYFLQE